MNATRYSSSSPFYVLRDTLIRVSGLPTDPLLVSDALLRLLWPIVWSSGFGKYFYGVKYPFVLVMSATIVLNVISSVVETSINDK